MSFPSFVVSLEQHVFHVQFVCRCTCTVLFYRWEFSDFGLGFITVSRLGFITVSRLTLFFFSSRPPPPAPTPSHTHTHTHTPPVSLIKPQDSFNPLFKEVVYTLSWIRKFENNEELRFQHGHVFLVFGRN